jgi:hypothetical protein
MTPDVVLISPVPKVFIFFDCVNIAPDCYMMAQ